MTEVVHQLAERVAVTVLSGLFQAGFVAFEPGIRPRLKGDVLRDQTFLLLLLESLDLFLDFLLCFAVKILEFGFAVGLIPAR